MDIAGRSDVGRVRGNNEDSFKLLPELNLFVLSDGMGGEAHGEVASALAVETITQHCLEATKNPGLPMEGEPRLDLSEKSNRLLSAVRLANRRIYEQAQADTSKKGMGATVVAVWVDGERMCVVHVGDSRAYLLRAGDLQQLTEDHSLVAEQVRRGILTRQQADTSKNQSVLLRALGIDETVEADAAEHVLIDGDVILMCSDGLDRMVTDPEIASAILTSSGSESTVERLIELALENGGEDNVTVVVLRVQKVHDGFLLRLWRWLNGPLSPDS
jgi:serine/threonine protein phosphatase PrpC